MAFDTIGLFGLRLDSAEQHDSKHDEESMPSVVDKDLTTLTPGQRVTFTVTVAILCILSVLGNLGTLYANQRRKLRIFFRTCLISLALSDLITTVFMTVGYLMQFGEAYVQIWCLGEFLCCFIPFVTTGAILVSSMTLVGIALDRYFAVMKAVIGFWNPNKVLCIVYATSVWTLSFAIASPMYSAYTIVHVYILSAGIDRKDSSELVPIDLVHMCVSDKESNAYYYVVVLAIIFVPTLVAFVWLNSIIANKLWIRRHSVRTPEPASAIATAPAPGAAPSRRGTPSSSALSGGPATPAAAAAAAVVCSGKAKEKQLEMAHSCQWQEDNKICTSSVLTVPTSLAATTTTTSTTKSTKNNPKTNTAAGTESEGNNAKHISSREARHLRMFTIVLILMAVFILFRLPAWIFLILRMYGTYTRPVHWILHFSFGILTLTSCVLNPLLYTFLAETIQYAMFMKGKLCGLRRYFANCGCHGCSASDDDGDSEKMTQNHSQNQDVNQNYNGNDDDGTSNDGAKSTSRNSGGDDSPGYTIIPVQKDVLQQGKRVGS